MELEELIEEFKNEDSQAKEEIKNIKKNKLFLMIKDNYCVEGIKLTPPVACFFAFLVFLSDRFIHNSKNVKAYIGYSNKTLSDIYSSKWFPTSERSVSLYLSELKKVKLITIENNGKASRKIFINYVKVRPELLGMVEDSIVDEYKEKIKELSEKLEEANKQNKLLLNQIVVQNTDTKEIALGLFTKVLYDKKYLTEKDNLVRSQLEDYNAMLKSMLFQFQKQGIDFFKTLNYVCAKAEKKKIKNKFIYLYSALNNNLNQIVNMPDELYPNDEE